MKFLDMAVYFPKSLRETNVRRMAEDIFLRGRRVKAELRKGVWPHLVRAFHPDLETKEEREGYLSKLRLIYDSLKGRLQSPSDTFARQSQHLYESIRRDAVRTDPTESFYHRHGTSPLNRSTAGSLTSLEASYLTRENVEKLVNITAVYTLEHEEVSYTQGMTDLLSPILYVMEREDDAYIVFSAMVQRIADNFGTWCEGTLKKTERLRHLCSVLDPELAAYLAEIEEDAFALFFGMVLIECRREFSFGDSFHLMEVIWSAALCMQQREDPFWSPPSQTGGGEGGGGGGGGGGGAPVERKGRSTIQALSPDRESVDFDLGTPSHSEWASFMSNRSPDVIRQVFGELQTYTAVPLTRSECGSISYGFFHRSHTPPPPPPPPPPTSSARCLTAQEAANLHHHQTTHSEDTAATHDAGLATVAVEVHERDSHQPSEEKPSEAAATSPLEKERERLCARPIRSRAATFTHGCKTPSNRSTIESETVYPPQGNSKCNDITPVEYTTAIISNGTLTKVNSHSENDLVKSVPSSPPPVLKGMTRTTTEMSDMSSVESTNTGGGRGGLVVSMEGEGGGGGGGREGREGDGEGGEEGGRKTRDIGEGFSDGCERNSDQEDNDDHWLVVIPDEINTATGVENFQTMPSERQGGNDRSQLIGGDGGQENSPGQSGNNNFSDVPVQNGGPPWARDEFVCATIEPGVSHGSFCEVESPPPPPPLPMPQLEKPVLRHDTQPGPNSDINTTVTAGAASSDSPSSAHEGTDSTIGDHASLTTDPDNRALSPIQPFFDALRTLAGSRVNSPALPETMRREEEVARRPSFSVSAIVANLISSEHSAPSVTRDSSLSVPFSDSFPLFVCLSIIVQQRGKILRGNLDFVGLSVLLNTQAGAQNLKLTLRIARQLYDRYREYQRLCFGPRFSVYEIWLDNTESFFGGRRNGDSLHDQHRRDNSDSQTTGRII